MNDLDSILKELNQFGTYQVLVYFLIFFPIALNAAASVSYIFAADDIDYRCFIPECEVNGTMINDQSWLYYTIPSNNINKCLRYKPYTSNDTCSRDVFSNETEECDKFVFGKEENTITKEFNLLCGRNVWKRTLIGTLNSLANLLALPFPGLISDRFGRKTLFTLSLTLSAVFGILRSFSTSYFQYVVLEMLDAMSYTGVFSCLYIYGIEIVGPDKRALGGALINMYYSLGEIFLGAAVWLFPDWRIYLRVIYIPTIFVVIYSWFMPESIRWLIARKKKDEVTKTIETIARWNGKTVSEETEKSIKNICFQDTSEDTKKEAKNGERKTKYPLKEIFHSRIMIIRVLICSFCWITSRFVFYGLSLNSVSIGGNKYLNYIVVSAVEIPGYLLSILMVNYCGRKLSVYLGLVTSTAACLIFYFINEASSQLSLILYFIGKIGITESYAALYILASEMFPTDLRNSLIAFSSTMGRIGSMLAPQIPLLAIFIDPLLVFSIFTFIAAVLAFLYLPETKNITLPDNLRDAVDIGTTVDKNTKV